jgi:hypothetical protein
VDGWAVVGVGRQARGDGGRRGARLNGESREGGWGSGGGGCTSHPLPRQPPHRPWEWLRGHP